MIRNILQKQYIYLPLSSSGWVYYIGKKQVEMFATEGLSLNLSGSADGRDGHRISNIQTFCTSLIYDYM